jgi:uncharacterized protein (DUF4415 family)
MTQNDKRIVRPISDEEEAAIQRGMALDPDNPEWTEEEFRNARPFVEVFPELAESIRRSRGRPALANPKRQVTLRLDDEVVTRLRAGGPGWQSRINDILRKAVGL